MKLYYLKATFNGVDHMGETWDNVKACFYKPLGEKRDAEALVKDWDDLDEIGKDFAQGFIDELLTVEEVEALVGHIENKLTTDTGLTNLVKLEPCAFQFPRMVGSIMPQGAIFGLNWEMGLGITINGINYCGDYNVYDGIAKLRPKVVLTLSYRQVQTLTELVSLSYQGEDEGVMDLIELQRLLQAAGGKPTDFGNTWPAWFRSSKKLNVTNREDLEKLN